jgi:hypothetical protein
MCSLQAELRAETERQRDKRSLGLGPGESVMPSLSESKLERRFLGIYKSLLRKVGHDIFGINPTTFKINHMSNLSLHSFYAVTSALNGTVFGTLLFGGFVDCRTLLQLVSAKDPDEDVAKALSVGFSLWWPNGASLMIPLIASGVVLNAYTYFKSRNSLWLLSLCSHLSILAWTALVMAKDIKLLMSASSLSIGPSELRASIISFSFLHAVRIAISAVGALAGNFAHS